ncbi:hypothetical protein C9168_08415 [Escherichia coli]|uniref:Uncharacterized protein n=2 Tax=Enterobacteriaceae TaxID=543 RepID=A0A3J1CHI3_ECOLX|nr:hypothetical protein B9127_00920 [Shigella sonnei]EFI3427354.1 hypothetical protein [Escherichia coli]PQM85808.1 hypothetical protein C5K26_03405 [Shigella flexneri]PQN09723.1 hypothetical protein C5K18_06565 [Shigella dysenteriae]PQN32628.1 hypothetical protein C5K23_15860 [Shigella boydii]
MISLMIVSENTRVWWHQAELTGRHPAPCSIQRLGIYPGSSSQEPFYMQKKTAPGKSGWQEETI